MSTPRRSPRRRKAAAVTASLLALLVAASCARGGRANTASLPVTISVVGTSDLHGAVLAQSGRGGLPLLEGFVANLRAARTADAGGVLLLDAGDMFQGTLESNLNEGAVVVAAYNALGYHASAIGNHEFDFGPVGESSVPRGPEDDPRGALKARAAEARFPFLAANIMDAATNRPVAWKNVTPSTLVSIAGVRVGIVGLATTDTLTATLAANVRGLRIAPLVSALVSEAKRLRRLGATVVVAAAHAGGSCTRFDDPQDLSSCNETEEIFEVARALEPGLVDAIVAGHRHTGVAHVVSGIPIISSFSSGRAFGRVDLYVDRRTRRVQRAKVFPPEYVCAKHDAATRQCVDDSAPAAVQAEYEHRPIVASARIGDILAPAVTRASDAKARSLNTSAEDVFPQDRSDESALGNVISDWMRNAAGADIAISNSGGIRSSLPSGPLTYGRLYEVMPFDNREVMLSLTGAEIRRIVAASLQRSGSMLLLAGVRAGATCQGGALHVTLRRDSGAPVADEERLAVVTSDFIATGGDDLLAPVMPVRVVGSLMDGPIVRDRIAEWLTKNNSRWRPADVFGPDKRRIVYSGARPVACER